MQSLLSLFTTICFQTVSRTFFSIFLPCVLQVPYCFLLLAFISADIEKSMQVPLLVSPMIATIQEILKIPSVTTGSNACCLRISDQGKKTSHHSGRKCLSQLSCKEYTEYNRTIFRTPFFTSASSITSVIIAQITMLNNPMSDKCKNIKCNVDPHIIRMNDQTQRLLTAPIRHAAAESSFFSKSGCQFPARGAQITSTAMLLKEETADCAPALL